MARAGGDGEGHGEGVVHVAARRQFRRRSRRGGGRRKPTVRMGMSFGHDAGGVGFALGEEDGPQGGRG